MKKFFIGLCSALILASCSSHDDQTTVFNNEAKSLMAEPTLTSLFIDMMATQNYKEMTDMRDKFVGKMHYTGNGANITDKASILTWISANLSQTGFASIDEAEHEWYDYEMKTLDVVKENDKYYDALANASSDELMEFSGVLVDILIPNEPVPESAGPWEDCVRACAGQLRTCHQNWFNSLQLKVSLAYVLGGPTGAAAQAAVNQANYSLPNPCGPSFRACNDDCYDKYRK